MNEEPIVIRERPGSEYTVVTVGGHSYAFAKRDMLGEGSFGAVYAAYPYNPTTHTRDERDAKKVVVKMITMDEDNPEDELQDEVKLLEKKRFGVKGSYTDEKNGRFYIVMEFAGTELNPKKLALDIKGSFSEVVKTAWMIALELNRINHNTLYEKEVAEALVHSDIKPQNIFIKVERNQVKDVRIGDFGLASIIEDETTARVHSRGGTQGYSPPEADRGEDVGLKGDIYSLGKVFEKLFVAVKKNTPPEVLPKLDKMIEKMQSKEDEKRPDVDEVLKFFTVLHQYAKATTDEQKADCLKALTSGTSSQKEEVHKGPQIQAPTKPR